VPLFFCTWRRALAERRELCAWRRAQFRALMDRYHLFEQQKALAKGADRISTLRAWRSMAFRLQHCARSERLELAQRHWRAELHWFALARLLIARAHSAHAAAVARVHYSQVRTCLAKQRIQALARRVLKNEMIAAIENAQSRLAAKREHKRLFEVCLYCFESWQLKTQVRRLARRVTRSAFVAAGREFHTKVRFAAAVRIQQWYRTVTAERRQRELALTWTWLRWLRWKRIVKRLASVEVPQLCLTCGFCFDFDVAPFVPLLIDFGSRFEPLRSSLRISLLESDCLVETTSSGIIAGFEVPVVLISQMSNLIDGVLSCASLLSLIGASDFPVSRRSESQSQSQSPIQFSSYFDEFIFPTIVSTISSSHSLIVSSCDIVTPISKEDLLIDRQVRRRETYELHQSILTQFDDLLASIFNHIMINESFHFCVAESSYISSSVNSDSDSDFDSVAEIESSKLLINFSIHFAEFLQSALAQISIDGAFIDCILM
jgi:hypothetical protein